MLPTILTAQYEDILRRPGALKDWNTKQSTTFALGGGAALLLRDGIFANVTAISNLKTTKLLLDLDKVMKESGARKYGYEEPEILKNLFQEKLPGLFVENLDIYKSVGRGFTDMVKGNPLKTQMKNKIKTELLDPLKNYIATEPSIPEPDREKLASKLDKIEQNYFSSKGRG